MLKCQKCWHFNFYQHDKHNIKYTDELKKTCHLLKCYFMSKIGYFHYEKNKIDKFRHLACIQ